MTTISKPQTKNQSLKRFWQEKRENGKDFLRKITFLENFKSKDMVVIGYPSGIPFVTVQQVCRCVDKSSDFFDHFVCSILSVGHKKEYHLIKNETDLHTRYEKLQNETGRQNSLLIKDIGEFRIAKINEVVFMDEADFTLYCVDENLVV